mmetsp:Transcript_53478/g.143094  ORF Transcript_53478/g.143094 Transcript_53478/m.143094 type:complete len:226 (-) Transcript_53478:104-781(-)
MKNAVTEQKAAPDAVGEIVVDESVDESAVGDGVVGGGVGAGVVGGGVGDGVGEDIWLVVTSHESLSISLSSPWPPNSKTVLSESATIVLSLRACGTSLERVSCVQVAKPPDTVTCHQSLSVEVPVVPPNSKAPLSGSAAMVCFERAEGASTELVSGVHVATSPHTVSCHGVLLALFLVQALRRAMPSRPREQPCRVRYESLVRRPKCPTVFKWPRRQTPTPASSR